MRFVLLLVTVLCTVVSLTSFADGSLSVNTSVQYDSAASKFDNTLSFEAGLGGSVFPNDRLSLFGDVATGLEYETTTGTFQAVGSANGLLSYRSGPWYAGFSLDALQYYLKRADGGDATLSLGIRLPLRYGGIGASVYLEPRFEVSNIRSFDFSAADISPNGSLGTAVLVADALVLDAALSGIYTRNADDTYRTGWDGQLTATWYPTVPVVVNGRFSAGRIESSRLAQLIPEGEFLPVYNRTELLLDAGVAGAFGDVTYEVSAPMQLQIYDHGIVEGSTVTDVNRLTFVSTVRGAVRAGMTRNLDIHSNLTIQTKLSNAQQAPATTLSCILGVTYRF